MVMASADKKVRYVKCPKCNKILIEIVDVPVYQCGGCGTLLQAKRYNATRDNVSSGSVQMKESSNSLVDEPSENGADSKRKEITPSSNGVTTESARMTDHSIPSVLSSCTSSVERGESHVIGENGIKEEVSGRDQLESRGEAESTFQSQPDGSIQIGREQCLKEEAEKPVKVSIGENGVREVVSVRDQLESRGDADNIFKSQPDGSIEIRREQYLKEEAKNPVKFSIRESGSKEEVSSWDQLESIGDAESTFKSQPNGSIQIRREQNLKEEAEKPMKLSQQACDNLLSSGKLEKLQESSETGDNCIEQNDSNTDQPAFGQNSDHTANRLQNESILPEVDYCLIEKGEKSPQKSPSVTSYELKESPESVSKTVATVENFFDEVHGHRDAGCLQFPRSAEAYEESISSCNDQTNDNVGDKHFQLRTEHFRLQRVTGYTHTKEAGGGFALRNNKLQKYSLKARMNRFLSNRDGSSSRHIHMQERGTSLDSSNFHSLQNWKGSESTPRLISRGSTFCGDSLSFEDTTASTKLKRLEEDRLELLKMVDKLRYQLSRNYCRRGGEGRSQFRTPPLHPNYIGRHRGTHYQLRTSVLQQYQFPQMPLPGQSCSCLECRLEDNLSSLSDFSHDGLSKACACSVCSHPSIAVNPHLHKGSLQFNEKRQSSKRYCRPLSGGAPFVICYKCSEVLQLPADVLISRRRMMKLQCGACSEVLLFSFPFDARTMTWSPIEELHPDNKADNRAVASNGHEVSVSHANDCSQGDPVSFSEEPGISFNRSCSIEPETSLDVAINSSEGKNGRRASSSALHRLMGYYSATQVMCQPNNSDEEYESAESTIHHSRRPSEASQVTTD